MNPYNYLIISRHRDSELFIKDYLRPHLYLAKVIANSILGRGEYPYEKSG